MSSATTSSQRGTAAPERIGTEWLRCPGERRALVMCMASNFVVVAIAFAIIMAGTDWLEAHPIIAKRFDWIRAIAIAALVAFPATGLGRHADIHAARNCGVRVGKDQFPELHDQLLRACRMLGIERIPELYVARQLIDGPAIAYSAWHYPSIVVINADLFHKRCKRWEDGLDWITFEMARALGSLRLGHTRWWVVLLTGYSRRIPGLRTRLLMKEAFSQDRCAAFVVPDGIRGLVVEAVGKNVTPNVDLAEFVKQADHVDGFWNYLAAFRRKSPLLTARAEALYEAGLFDRARDLERHRPQPHAASGVPLR